MTGLKSPLTTSVPHLGSLADRHVAQHGDYPFLLFDGTWHSSGDLLSRSQRIAGGLLELGLQPNDRVVVTMPNVPEVPIVYNAIWRAGGVVAPAMHLQSAVELHHVLHDSGARFVVTTSELVPHVSHAMHDLPESPLIISVGPASDAIEFESLETAEPAAVVPRQPGDLAALLYTGGTTGRSKGVMLSHTNLLCASQAGTAYEHELGLSRELLVLPLSHAFGLIATIGTQLSEMRKIWVMPRRFDAANAIELIEEHRLDELQAVPSMLQKILDQPLEQADLSSFRAVFSGGSPLSPEVFDAFQRRIPTAQIFEGYGLTENSTLATATPVGAVRRGSVGKALPGVEIRILDSDGEEARRGETGEIATRSDAVMMGYWNDPEATAEALVDGWLLTGDVGCMDEDDYIYVMDRKKDLIIRGGFNVFPRDVEEALLEHPAVHSAAVVGRPDRVLGEEITAFVCLNSGEDLSAEEIIEWSKGRLGSYKRPREVAIVDSLPLTGVGKLDRKALRRSVTARGSGGRAD